MATHDALYPLILPDVPQCAFPTVDTAINRAAQEFCRGSLCWADTQTVSLLPNVREYAITVPADADLVVVRRASIDKRMMRGESNAQEIIDRREGFGEPAIYAVLGSTLYVTPTPNEAGKVATLLCAFAPRFTASVLPEVLVGRYAEAIASGALAILKRMPGNAWTDPQGAVTAYQLFQLRKAEARIEYESGRVAGSLRVTPRRFGGW